MASSGSSSPWETIYRSIAQRHQTIFESVSYIIEAFPKLSTVKSCAMLGCGSGYFDLEFVRRYLPNVERLTAVEPDADQMAAFKTRVAELLSDVSVEFCQETAQSWKGSDQPLDAVLLFHVLSYIPETEQAVLIKKLFEKVVANGGLVFIITAPCSVQDPTSVRRLLVDLLSIRSYNVYYLADVVRVRDLMTSAGFRESYQLPVEYRVDLKEESDMEDVISVFEFWSRGMLSRERIREALREVAGSEKCIETDAWFGMFEKQ